MVKQVVAIAGAIMLMVLVLCPPAGFVSALASSSSPPENILSFRLVHPDNDDLSRLPPSAVRVDRERYEHLVDREGASYWVDKKIELNAADIKSVRTILSYMGPDMKEVVREATPEFIARNPHFRDLPDYGAELFFTGKGAGKILGLTRKSLKRRLAMVFDGKVLAAPVIWREIDGGVVWIAPTLTYKDAKRVKDAIDDAIAVSRNRVVL